MNNLSLRDKQDQGAGLSLHDATTNNITTLNYILNVDTRDCIGAASLEDAELAFELSGGRARINGQVSNATGIGISPIVVNLSSISNLKNNDTIFIKGVQGNTAVNGKHVIVNIDYIAGTAELLNTTGNGQFRSAGTYYRNQDPSYPHITEYSNIVRGNEMIIQITDTLKQIREISIEYVTIPRDIIPIQVYLQDLIRNSTNYQNKTYSSNVSTNWSTFIPQEEDFLEERLLGFYSSPLDIFRSYINGAFSMQDAVTPAPLTLWNPPQGVWPEQPVPYPFQTVPTYQSNEFPISGYSGTFHLVLGGYGVYDLKDWTSKTGVPVTDAAITSIVRKLLLLLITPVQSYNNVDYINMILNCNTVDVGNTVEPYGYGDFQRFVPGPGLQLNYQPGTSDNADPTVVGPDWVVPFPNFRGNVWGPYDTPSDRFQKLGLRSTIQDLYLNGDLQNLLGSPIIKPNVPTEYLMDDPTYGLDFSIFINVDLNNVSQSSNLNILNAMRILPNGFGTSSVRANGSGATYTNIYRSGGGQGPSVMGPPSQWSSTGVNGTSGTFSDPVASGPSSSVQIPQTSDPSTVNISHRSGWYDSGPNNGQFIFQVNNYVGFLINDITDTDLVMFIEEDLRSERSLSTNQTLKDATFQLPMRLNLGTQSGTMQYIESQYSLLTGCPFWKKRFLTPRSKLRELHIRFQTFNGMPIDLEKMLQRRKSSYFLQLFSGILNDSLDIVPDLTNLNLYFLFDPFSPLLVGRTKRYIQMILNFECYQYVLPGMIPDAIGEKRMSLTDPPSSFGPNSVPENDFVAPYEPYQNYA